MKKIVILLLNIYLVVLSVFGQENALYREVRQAKEANTYFENVVLTKTSANVEILQDFINPNEVSFFENTSFNSRNNETKAINLFIPFKTEVIVLELVEVPDYFYEYEIITSEWERFPANRNIKHYRGVVKDDERSLAAVTFYEDEIMGIVATSEGNFNIAKNKQSGKHLFYNDKNLIAKPDWVCEKEDDPSVTYDSEVLFDLDNKGETSRGNKIVRFFVETEYDIYQNKGSVHEVEVYISGLFNQVAALYQNENINIYVSYLFIWTTNVSYPYTGKNTSADLLDQFEKTRTSITGDLGMLLTLKNIGGRAHVDGLCKILTKNKLGVCGIYNYYNVVPVYSWSVKGVTHEFGHLLGSEHTHDCVWNGNNTAIDGCGPNAGYPGDGNCSNPGDPLGGGTIMSYCQHRPVGINLSLGFGTQPGNLIRNNVSKANCLVDCYVITINNETYQSGKTYTEIGCQIKISNTTFKANTDVKIHGQDRIVLQSGTKAEYGAYVKFTAGALVHVESKSANIQDKDLYDETKLSDLEKLSAIEQETTDMYVYPNPNDGNFSVKIIGEINPYTIEIFNSSGGMLGTVNCNEELVGINRSDLNAGIYYVKLTMGDKVVVKKVIVQ